VAVLPSGPPWNTAAGRPKVGLTIPIPSLAGAAIDSERAVLGIAILEPVRVRDEGLLSLAVEDFGLPTHREAWRGILALDADSESWDMLVLVEHLRKNGRLAAAGGAAFVADLTSGIPRRMALTCHIQAVKSAALRRCMGRLGENLLIHAQDGTAEPEQSLSWIREQLDHLEDRESSTAGKRRPVLVQLSTVMPMPVTWLWEPYLAKGMLAMLSGDPGGGKTYLALAIAAALSRGRSPYEGTPCRPVDMLYLSIENSPEHVIRPRYDALQGDSTRMHLLSGSITGKTQHGSVSLKDVELLGDALKQTKAGLVIVDPIQSYLGADVDAHRSNETRPVMDGLTRLAVEHETCILLVRHLSKASGGRAIHRGLGSIDLTGAVRTELLAGTAPDAPDSRAMVQVKSNLGRFGESLAFAIDKDGAFQWQGKSSLSAMDLLAPDGDAESRSDIAEAVDFLQEQLGNGPRAAKELAEASGIPMRTLQRAAQKVGVNRSRDGERGAWVWSIDDKKTHRRQHSELSSMQKTVAYAH
jgi:AAA domain/DnaB-like helicase N terminal domain